MGDSPLKREAVCGDDSDIEHRLNGEDVDIIELVSVPRFMVYPS